MRDRDQIGRLPPSSATQHRSTGNFSRVKPLETCSSIAGCKIGMRSAPCRLLVTVSRPTPSLEFKPESGNVAEFGNSKVAIYGNISVFSKVSENGTLSKILYSETFPFTEIIAFPYKAIGSAADPSPAPG